jgi:hypothetical protein
LDTILSGMGIIVLGAQGSTSYTEGAPQAAHEETGDFIRARVKQEEGLTEAYLARLVYGDIGGWLIERKGLRDADLDLVQSLNQGWTGVKGPHFSKVAGNAKPSGAPGVILIAAGASKAAMIMELVKRGFVNELLIDSSLAAALKT